MVFAVAVNVAIGNYDGAFSFALGALLGLAGWALISLRRRKSRTERPERPVHSGW